MNPLYPSVSLCAIFRCEYCRAPEQVFNFAFDVEPIAPRSGGGDDALANLALACESCNSFKSNFTVGWDELEKREVRLFHPRLDTWSQHFTFDAVSAEITGLTATGRVTASRLKMNSAFQVRARRQWVLLGLYP